MKQSLAIALSNRDSASARDLLVLEQKEWGTATGGVSKPQLVEYLGRITYGEDTEYGWSESLDCGMEGGGCAVTVYAYPASPALPYQIAATWGLLGGRVLDEFVQQEVLEFSLADEGRTKYPSQGIISALAVGNLYDENGVVIPLPAITCALDTVRLGRRVYGAILVKYLVLRHVYSLRVERRDPETTVENFFSTVVYGWYDGGGAYLEIEPPPGAEEYAADAACGFGQSTGEDDDDDDGYPEIPDAAGANRIIVHDYCSGAVISDNTYGT
jgi:hypothetical protein